MMMMVALVSERVEDSDDSNSDNDVSEIKGTKYVTAMLTIYSPET